MARHVKKPAKTGRWAARGGALLLAALAVGCAPVTVATKAAAVQGDPGKAQAAAAAAGRLQPESVATLRQRLAQWRKGETAADAAFIQQMRGLSSALMDPATGAEAVDVATALNDLAGLFYGTGDYTRARPLYERSLAIYEKALGPEHPDVATSLNNLAGLFRATGDYARARPLYERSLAIREKALGPDHPAVATSLNNLAALFDDTGDYARARPLYERSLAIREKALGPEHPDVATSLNNLAELFRATGDYARARPLFERSLANMEKALGPEHPNVATSLNNLAALFDDTGDYARARPLYERSLAIREKALGPEHPDVADSLNDLAALFYITGDYARARPLYERSLAIREKALGPEHPSLAYILAGLAATNAAGGELDTALPMLHRAIAVATPERLDALLQAEDALRRVHARAGHPELAILWGKRAVNTMQARRAGVAGLERETQRLFVESNRGTYTALADLLVAQGRIEEAQVVLQMLKEHELRDGFLRSDAKDPRSTRIELTGLERSSFARFYELREQQAALGAERRALEIKRKLGAASATDLARLEEITTRLFPELQAAMVGFLGSLNERVLAQRRPGQEVTNVKATATRLRRAVLELARSEPDSAAVGLQYYAMDDRLSIILTTPGAPPLAREVPISRQRLNEQVTRLRVLLNTAGASADERPLKQVLAELYAAMVAPIRADLEAAGARTLMVAAYDVLRYVPVAALTDGTRYLVEDFAVVSFSDSAFQLPGDSSAPEWRVAGLGLTQPIEAEGLSALPQVRAELQGILQQPGIQGQPWLDQQFNRDRLSAVLTAQRFNVLHIASHFVFTAGRPDASRLYLGDRSPLSLAEVAAQDMRFDGFDLVTFSACESAIGGGRDSHGQEMESLGAKVQNQGAQAVMATLWKVYDESTAKFMQEFYRLRAQPGTNKAEALRATQLEFIQGKVRRSSAKAYTHVYFWAPFVLMGNWR